MMLSDVCLSVCHIHWA